MSHGSSTMSHGSSTTFQKGPIISHEGPGMPHGSFRSPHGSSIVKPPQRTEDRWTFTKLSRFVRPGVHNAFLSSKNQFHTPLLLSISAPTMSHGSLGMQHGSSTQKGPIISHGSFCSPRGSSIVNVPEGREDRWTFTKSSLFVRVRALIIALHIQL